MRASEMAVNRTNKWKIDFSWQYIVRYANKSLKAIFMALYGQTDSMLRGKMVSISPSFFHRYRNDFNVEIQLKSTHSSADFC